MQRDFLGKSISRMTGGKSFAVVPLRPLQKADAGVGSCPLASAYYKTENGSSKMIALFNSRGTFQMLRAGSHPGAAR